MTSRKRIPQQSQTELLTRSGRRCCLCYGLYGDGSVKEGQIAHIDRDPSNAEFDNLAFLCLDHHNQYDSKPSQSKRFTPSELKEYRDQLFEAFEQFQAERKLEPVEREPNWERTTPERFEPPEEALPPPDEQKTQKKRQQERALQSKLEKALAFALEDEEIIASYRERAEQLIAEGKHHQAAGIFAVLASRLAENKQPVQARKYARYAAKEYLAAENKTVAAEQLIFAAETWLTQTVYEPLHASNDLKEAEEVAAKAENFTLQARAVVLQAYLHLISGDHGKSKTFWQQAKSILLKVSGESQVELYCELALQQAMCARLAEDYADALEILREADMRDWSPSSRQKRLELLWVLLFLEAEIGDWDAVDQTYQKAQEILQNGRDSLQDGTWLMHYAGTLAKRGAENDAYEGYMEALNTLEKAHADVHQKYHLYQDMSHMLLRYVDFQISGPIISYDSRRLDLALNVLHEKQSSRHIERARQRYVEGRLEQAIQCVQSALILAWREGNWSGLAHAYRNLTFLYAANEQLTEAVFAALRTGDNKLVQEYAGRAASIADSKDAERVVYLLLNSWPSIPERTSALVALTNLSDIIPSDYVESAADFALSVLERASKGSSVGEAKHRAAELLRELVPRLSATYVNRALQPCIHRVPDAQPPIYKIELVRLIGACFQNERSIDPELTESALKVLLPLVDNDMLRSDVETALLHLGKNSPDRVHEQVVMHFQQKEDWIYLAALDEPIHEDRIRTTIERILEAITPRWTDDGIGYSGWRPQSITNFNNVLPPSLYDLVVDGLLEAAINTDGFANQRAAAIYTLRWLPVEALRTRANHISNSLLRLFEEDKSQSKKSFSNWLGGASTQIERSTLYTLGYLYKWVSSDRRQRILNQVLSSSFHDDRLVRLGAAMTLRLLEGAEPLSSEVTMVLERFLGDDEPAVRHWVGSAIGHLVTQSLIEEPLATYYVERLAALAIAEEDAFARAGMAYGLRVIADNYDLTSLPESVAESLEQLAEDVSFQVRQQAKPDQEAE